MKAATCLSLIPILALSACSKPGEPDQAQAPVAPDQAQTQPATPAPTLEVKAEGNVTTVTTAGNLKSTFDIGCIDFSQAKNVYSPADLFKGSVACFQAGDGGRGVKLFALAMAYGRFDIARVADTTAHQGMEVLKLSNFDAFSDEDKTMISEGFEAFTKDPDEWAPFCTRLRALGPPAYHPDYMIQHGMRAVQPWNQDGSNGLLADFDPDSTWRMVVDQYMKCSSGADAAAAASRNPGADQNNAAETSAATRVREAPMLAASAKTFVSEYFQSEGIWPDSNAQVGLPETSPQFPVSIGPGGVVTVHFDEPAELAGKSIVLTPSAGESGDFLSWECSAAEIPPALRAGNCR